LGFRDYTMPRPELNMESFELKVPIEDITVDARFQQREDLFNQSTVDLYAEAMKDGVEFPPIICIGTDDDPDYSVLVDGFQRFHAAKQAGLTEILAEFRTGTEREALLFSACANAAHGLHPSAADKRKAVTLLILDDEWSKWSDREIARHIGVGNKLVSTVRREMEAAGDIDSRDEVLAVRGGKTYRTAVNRDSDSPEHRMALRLIERLGSVDEAVAFLLSVSGHTSGGES
jgi:hypothetical protein